VLFPCLGRCDEWHGVTSLTTGQNNDKIVLSDFGGQVVVNTNAGDDIVDIGLGQDSATLSVSTGAGSDQIALAGTAMGSATVLDVGDGADLIQVSGDKLEAGIEIDGQAPTVTPGDTLLFDADVYVDEQDVQHPNSTVNGGSGAVENGGDGRRTHHR
jgi:hypothetical protein